ncbi:hypothetical protein [Pseudonocardia xishanensis]|uniref:Luciferase-like monooxygenase n=1 Tax=Pseudonocardia xishanensis TaxID=630995 RepID=A0ABP8RNT6_9PSEU
MAPFHLGVALDGAGWHPAAWREPGARPDLLFTARYRAAPARAAERGLLDLVTIDDGLGLATLDHDSLGRAGWRVQTSARADEATPDVHDRLLGSVLHGPRTGHSPAAAPPGTS